MSERSESAPAPAHDWLLAGRMDRSRAALTRAALINMGMEKSAMHFYGAFDAAVGFSGNDAQIVLHRSPQSEITAGVGPDLDAALDNMMDRMRSVETVETPSFARIAMTETAEVSFTRLEDYSPRVAPASTTRLVPDYLHSLVEDSNGCGDGTYETTKRYKNWETELCSVLGAFLEHYPEGRQLVTDLQINSLKHLTPEQAVKLSAGFVQSVSKYTHEDVGKDYPTSADTTTAIDLLTVGILRKGDPSWEGNGICRNIACNVKAVFEALKRIQADLSMLNNTYCVYNAAMYGVGYADSRIVREDEGPGHAWNTFVTIGPDGSAVATIVDVTWALGEGMGVSTEHIDQTETRAVAQMVQLFRKSQDKEWAFRGVVDGIEKVIDHSYSNTATSEEWRQDIREFAVTKYLEVAAQLPSVPLDHRMPNSVAEIIRQQLKDQLEAWEVAILLTLDKRED